MNKKDIYTAGLVLGILSIISVFSFIFLSWIFSIIGINLSVKNKKKNNTTPGLVLSMIGLSLSVNKLLLVIAIVISVL